MVINIKFSEIVEGTTVQTLTIEFVNGQNIKISDIVKISDTSGQTLNYSVIVI